MVNMTTETFAGGLASQAAITGTRLISQTRTKKRQPRSALQTASDQRERPLSTSSGSSDRVKGRALATRGFLG